MTLQAVTNHKILPQERFTMNRRHVSIIALLLAAIMLLGVLASCKNNNEQIETTSSPTSNETEGTTQGSVNETTEPQGGEDTTEPAGDDTTPGGDDTTPGGDETTKPSGGDETTKPADGEETTKPSGGEQTTKPADGEDVTEPEKGELVMNNADTIKHATSIMNGVNAYFTDGKRSDFMLTNQNMSLEYALSGGKNQQVTALVNTKGSAYITNTSDVFVTMTNGKTVYASKSTKAATANLYRLGYYMYEARFEEQNFLGSYVTEGAQSIPLTSVEGQQARVSQNDDGSYTVTLTNTTDPFFKVRGVNYSADEFPYMAVTMKTNVTGARSLTIYIESDTHSMGSTQSFIVTPSSDYVTYYIPLYRTSWYGGNVKSLRIDFEGAIKKGDVYDIKAIDVCKGDTEGLPDKLSINRSYFVYSDKLHEVIQVASDSVPTENIASIGVETKIAKDTVAKVVVKDKDGVKYSFDGVDWASVEYVGFDIKDTGIFGYILPAGDLTDKLEVKDDGANYVIIQSRTPENGTILNSGVYNKDTQKYDPVEKGKSNFNDFYMGHRLYTDENHDFDAFVLEAFLERNPLGENNFLLNKRDSSYECTYECPECGKEYLEYVTLCTACYNEITPIAHPNMYFKGYDALRGIYTFYVPGESFNAPYFQYPNKYINLTLAVRGDKYDRTIYFMPTTEIGCLECTVILDEKQMMLPIPIEVGKNFSEGSGERNLYNIEDLTYSEAIIPLVVKAGESHTYTVLNLYQNWGQYPLKQVSWIQFYAPYYHLSTGVTESNCIVPYYSCKNARGLGTLPDHRAASAPLWAGQPQHTSGGSHVWLKYTDKNGVFSASENTLDYIGSYGPIYADVYMDFLSDDGNIKVTYSHMEFPQVDENRAYYEMKYEVLGDVSFKNFAKDFCFYDLGDNDSKGSYVNIGYLDVNNKSQVVSTVTGNDVQKYVLGDVSPYFSFFNMPDYNRESDSAEGYVNLSFIIKDYEIILNGEKSDVHFVIVNEGDRVRLSLDLEAVTLKKGDTITINAIVMPWGSQELDPPENESDRVKNRNYYDTVVGTDDDGNPIYYMDKNVRDVRINTCLNPLTATAGENAEVIESVFLPKVRSTNGKSATFTLTGGQNNVAVRVYGFNMLTVPKIEEYVNGEWVEYVVSSAWKPDGYGYAHYYDGYSVYYDDDNTISYAFIVPMDYTDADGRTFRVSADKAFTGWPEELPEIEIDTSNLPMNVLVSASDIATNAKNECGSNLSSVKLSNDGTYVTLSSNSKAQEAYFHFWRGNGGKTVTGQYLVMKYRLPSTNNRKHSYIEFFTTTNGRSPDSKNCFGVSNALINDGEWHTLVLDFSDFGRENFQPDANGEYKIIKVRFDPFNEYYTDGNSIDIAFFGISDSIEEILAYYEVDTINLYTKSGLTSFDKQGNSIPNPSDNMSSTGVEGFTNYISASGIASAAKGTDGHIGGTTLSPDSKYVTLSYDSRRLESYITLFANNSKPTGQYLVLKYRTAQQAGYIEIYTSTETNNATEANSLGGRTSLSANNFLFAADNEWHTVVIDLSKALKPEAYKTNAAGEYAARFVRIDLFNFGSAQSGEYSVDLAYLGFCDSYEDAISHDENTWFYDGSKAINVKTGETITSLPESGGNSGGSGSGSGDSGITDATSSVPGFNLYFNATAVATAGKNTLWKDCVTLSPDGKFVTFDNHVNAAKDEHKNETYFTVYSTTEKKASGQYAVIKYKANVQEGTITLWSSTENAGAAAGSSFDLKSDNGLFIADNQWHIVVVDLSKVIKTFTPESGKYVATHLRIDLFNFGKPRDPADTLAQIDIAYIGLCDDYTEIITSDKSVAELLFYNGKTTVYSTETGAITEGAEPDPTPDPEPDPTPDPSAPTYNKYFNATAIILAAQNSEGGHTGDEELIDGTVARIYNNTAKMESYFYLFKNNTEVTGRYLVIKYRAETQKGYIQIYSSTQNAGASESGVFNMTKSNELFVADGKWHIVIIDLSKVNNTYTANGSGQFVATHLRLDLFNETISDSVYVDLAYVGICSDLSKAITEDKSVNTATVYDGSLKEYSTADGVALETPNFIVNADALSKQTDRAGLTYELSADGQYVTYTQTVGKDEGFAYVVYPNANVNVPKAPTGQYILIKYRTTFTGYWQMYIGANNGSTTAQGGKDSFSLGIKNGDRGAIVADGKWQYLIVDASFLAEWNGFLPEDGTTDTYVLDYFRIDYFNAKSDTANTTDVAYIAVADSVAKLVSYAGMDSYTYVDTYSDGILNETVTVK